MGNWKRMQRNQCKREWILWCLTAKDTNVFDNEYYNGCNAKLMSASIRQTFNGFMKDVEFMENYEWYIIIEHFEGNQQPHSLEIAEVLPSPLQLAVILHKSALLNDKFIKII